MKCLYLLDKTKVMRNGSPFLAMSALSDETKVEGVILDLIGEVIAEEILRTDLEAGLEVARVATVGAVSMNLPIEST